MQPLLPSDPRQVGPYAIIGRLGSGGFGEVFLGRSPGGRRVAVKLIRADRAQAPDFRARFRREVAAVQRVSGAFTASVIAADPDAERPWLVTEFVDGPSLEQAVRPGNAIRTLPADEVMALAAGLAEGLAVIHAADVIHRDLKPSNVILSDNGPRIIDFGISRDVGGTTVTQSDQIVGTPAFMSPEQVAGREVSQATDIFSLASVLTFAATGTGPFGSGEVTALLYRIVHEAPALDGVPELIRPLLKRCLAKDARPRPTATAILTEVARSDVPVAAATLPTARSGYNVTVVEAPGWPTTESGAADAGPRRRHVWRRALLAIGIAGLAAAAIGLLAGHLLTAGTAPPRLTPAAVIRNYVGAINAHDYRRAWRLGGDNLGSSYHTFVAGFRLTESVTIIALSASGDVVHLRTRAPETTGTVQWYSYTYVVKHGVIVKGKQTLLRSSP
jgi:tRNA A-37 threonylcarbamoyl transferase component Bud32